MGLHFLVLMKINASFLYAKRTSAVPLLYNQFTTKIMLKKVMQMSQNHFILDILGIKDPNIKVLAVETKLIRLNEMNNHFITLILNHILEMGSI